MPENKTIAGSKYATTLFELSEIEPENKTNNQSTNVIQITTSSTLF